MRTVRLDEIIRQEDPELKRAVEFLAQGHVKEAVRHLAEQGHVHEIKNAHERLTAIAASYVQDPESTLVVSPDNASRAQINSLIRERLQK